MLLEQGQGPALVQQWASGGWLAALQQAQPQALQQALGLGLQGPPRLLVQQPQAQVLPQAQVQPLQLPRLAQVPQLQVPQLAQGQGPLLLGPLQAPLLLQELGQPRQQGPPLLQGQELLPPQQGQGPRQQALPQGGPAQQVKAMGKQVSKQATKGGGFMEPQVLLGSRSCSMNGWRCVQPHADDEMCMLACGGHQEGLGQSTPRTLVFRGTSAQGSRQVGKGFRGADNAPHGPEIALGWPPTEGTRTLGTRPSASTQAPGTVPG